MKFGDRTSAQPEINENVNTVEAFLKTLKKLDKMAPINTDVTVKVKDLLALVQSHGALLHQLHQSGVIV
jgi:uncharacterized protein YqgV (UPF0045/DUF77 family)